MKTNDIEVLFDKICDETLKEGLASEFGDILGTNDRFFDVMIRCFEIIVVILALIIFSPLIFLICLAIFIESRGNHSTVFSQIRLGLNGESFQIYKFRTMVWDAEDALKKDQTLYDEYVNNGFKLDMNRDPRISFVGKFLRKTSLDELPQLYNVFLGQMSLVGPRPIVPAERNLYGEYACLLLQSKPGLTGLWQISGRDDIKYPDRIYIECLQSITKSYKLYITCILRTIYVVCKQKGIK